MGTWRAIVTKRLRIVQFEERHLTQRYVDWLNDPDVVRYSEQRHRRHDIASCRAYFEAMRKSDNFFCAIEEVEQGLGHIGNVSVAVDRQNRVADMAIMIGDKLCWGRGYGLEAWINVLDALFEREGMRKVSAGTVEPNQAMVAIMRKSGMTEDGRREGHMIVDGGPVDILHFASFHSRRFGETLETSGE